MFFKMAAEGAGTCKWLFTELNSNINTRITYLPLSSNLCVCTCACVCVHVCVFIFYGHHQAEGHIHHTTGIQPTHTHTINIQL